ncbi:UNVERIFIED_CONTAM: Histone-lysine N-methyltransferase ASHR1 [Sesamum radiatum]|uniref:Histone-lysine N-methyltransferase ASHR1 n=1 Tax=Sesamum radiatum TaxID=300843 RepID=A0AAW2PXN9_SESRA
MDELQKALNDKSLTISTLPEKGRCLFTTRDFFPGEVIISENPYVCVPNKNKESPQSKCEWCFSSSNLKKCSACHVVWYCSSKCQKSDWKLHSVECRALSKIDKDRLKSLTPSIRLMVRLYIRRKLEHEKIFPTTATDNYKHVEALVSHMSEVDEKQLVLYAQMANLVNLILQWPDSEVNIKEIAESFSKLACNAHTICDSELRPLGTGLYPVISIINHSCLPNSVLVFRGKVGCGTSYAAYSKRYRDNKGFICQQCGLLRDKEEIKNITNEVKLISEKASTSFSSGRSDKAEASVAYKMVEELQMKLYHPFSINLMRTRETLLKIFMELQEWKEALSYCRLTIPVYERVYPNAILCLDCSIICVENLNEAAVTSLTKALDILRITHGTTTPFMMELLSKLEEARAEASYMHHSQDED